MCSNSIAFRANIKDERTLEFNSAVGGSLKIGCMKARELLATEKFRMLHKVTILVLEQLIIDKYTSNGLLGQY